MIVIFQAQKLAEEAHIMGSIQCSKVSAELKSARSIVRLTEIQATLQEQRYVKLRPFIRLSNWRGTIVVAEYCFYVSRLKSWKNWSLKTRSCPTILSVYVCVYQCARTPNLACIKLRLDCDVLRATLLSNQFFKVTYQMGQTKMADLNHWRCDFWLQTSIWRRYNESIMTVGRRESSWHFSVVYVTKALLNFNRTAQLERIWLYKFLIFA